MPYKSEKIRLQGMQDRRRKLTDEQKIEIVRQYRSGYGSLNTLAKHFGVSKKTILILVNPKSAENSKQYIKVHWKDYQHDKEQRNKIMREHRHYKHELYMKDELNKKKEKN